jgi:hypothetical protein
MMLEGVRAYESILLYVIVVISLVVFIKDLIKEVMIQK